VLHGFGTADGTQLFSDRFPKAQASGFYQTANELTISTIGLGTYLGEEDRKTDEAYEAAAIEALRGGINLFDTAINYRNQRSERALGSAFRGLLNANEIQRDQLVICTKAGFITPGAIPEWLEEADVAGAMHCMTPRFLEDQIDRSRDNLDLDTIDICYLHNPETQLRFISRNEFESRLQHAFECLERLADTKRIRWFGTATWYGYRQPGQLDIDRIIELARYVGGEDHHFRFVQLPFSLGMVEAYTHRNQEGVSVLKAAARAGITVIASATLYQGRFATILPEVITNRIPGLRSAAARSVQFARSTPGIAAALVGMSKREHVRENLEVANVPPMGVADYEKLYRPVDS